MDEWALPAARSARFNARSARSSSAWPWREAEDSKPRHPITRTLAARAYPELS